MRRLRWIGVVVLVAACGRGFPTVPATGPAPGPLTATPSALLLAVDQPGFAALTGGYPPYALASNANALGECAGTLGADGGVFGFNFSNCLIPLFAQSYTVTDSDGGTTSVQVSVGSALQSSIAESNQDPQGCQAIGLEITGGREPYYLLQADGSAMPSCDGGALANVTLTSFTFGAPAYRADGGNHYEVNLVDAIEYTREPDPNGKNVVAFTIDVQPPASSKQPLAANPGALLLAVDQEGSVSLSGGLPPYRLLQGFETAGNTDAGCWAYLSADAGSLIFHPCLQPDFQTTLLVGDGSNADSLSIPVAVGAALEASVPSQVSQPGCTAVQFTIGGGLAPYYLVVDGGAGGTCAAGSPWQLVASGLTTSTFLIPPFSSGGASQNQYAVQLMDEVEHERLLDAGAATNSNVIAFQVTVLNPLQTALRAEPPSIYAAVDQVVSVAISGGAPSYALVDAGPIGCPLALTVAADGGSLLAFGPCATPFFEADVTVKDSLDSQIAVPVSVGPAFQTDRTGEELVELPCAAVVASVTGGKAPYWVLLRDGGSIPNGGCPTTDAGPPGLTTLTFFAPPFDDAGNNSYGLVLMDDVEHQKETAGGGVDVNNVAPFGLTVEPPAAPPPVVSGPVTLFVPPLQSASVAVKFPGRTMSFAVSYNGNSSGGSLDATTGIYTAGGNPNTVDHLIATDLSEDAGPFDVWIEVGSPSVTPPFFGGNVLLAGDVNGDGIDDLVDETQGSGAASIGVILGSTTVASVAPSIYLPGQNLTGLELADVNGDGRQDLVLAYGDSSGGQPPTATCGYSPPTGCLLDGSPDLGSTVGNCYTLGDGGISCGANLYDSSGSLLVSLTFPGSAGTFLDGGVAFLSVPAPGDAPGVTIGCWFPPSMGGGTVPSQCTAGCLSVKLDGGASGSFCNGSWGCGPAGCLPNGAHEIINSGGASGLFEVPAGTNQPSPVSCDGGGTMSCGPFTCTPDGFGGYDCGPRDCLPDSEGNLFCNTASCEVPANGYSAACANDGPGTDVCDGCQPPTGSMVVAYTSLPGGGFLNVGAIPGAYQALVGDEGGGDLLIAGGVELQGSSQAGAQTFTRQSGPLFQLNQGDVGNARHVHVARLADGTPWAAVEVTPGGGPNNTSYRLDWVTSSAGLGSLTFAGLSNQQSQVDPVGLVDFTGSAGESVVVADGLDDGGLALLVFDPPGAECPTFGSVVPDGGTEVAFPLVDGGVVVGGAPFSALVANPYPGGGPVPAQQYLALQSVRGFGVGFQPPSVVQLGDTFELFTRSSGCGLSLTPWHQFQLPELDGAVIASLASGDFNGDGQPDLAVSSPDSLDFYLGNVGGTFAQGNLYSVASPIAQLSTSQFQDGGGLVVGFGIDDSASVFALASNASPAAGPSAPVSRLSALGFIPAPTSGTKGGLLRGGDLWVVGTPSADAGTTDMVLTRYPQIANYLGGTGALPPPVTTPLPGFPATAGIVDYSQLLAPLPGRDDAAWLVMSAPGAGLLVGLVTASGGGVQLAMTSSAFPPGSAGAFEPIGDGGLELATTINGALSVGYYASANGTVSFTPLPLPSPLPNPKFLPECHPNDPIVLVAGGDQLLLAGAAVDPSQPDGGRLTCFNGGNEGNTFFVLDPVAHTFEPAAGIPPSSEVHRSWLSPFPDGGAEILAFDVNVTGLLGLLPAGGGVWQNDPAFTSSGLYVGATAFTTQDGGAFHVLSQVSPASLQVIAR